MSDHITAYFDMTPEEREQSYIRFLVGMAEGYGMNISNPPGLLEIVVIWATRLKNAWESADTHPENPYCGDEIDYSEDMLKEAVKDWIASL